MHRVVSSRFSNIVKFLPNTGNKVFNVIIVAIIIVSFVGIVTYAVAFFKYLTQNNLAKMFPYVMFILSYCMIISYSINYFIKQKFESICPVIGSFSMVVLMSTLNLQNVNNQVVLLAIVIAVLASFIKNNLSVYRRCCVLFAVVLVLVILLIFLRFYYGYISLETDNTYEAALSVYSNFRLVILWIMLGLLYHMRASLVFKKYSYEVETKGYKEAKANYSV